MKYYFIESVNTLSTSGKTRKGALLQSAVSSLEHHVLSAPALDLLIAQLRALVVAVNTSCKGKPVELSVHHDAGYIAAHPIATGSEPYIFQISYAEMLTEIRPEHLRPQITADLAMHSTSVANLFVALSTIAAPAKKGGESCK